MIILRQKMQQEKIGSEGQVELFDYLSMVGGKRKKMGE